MPALPPSQGALGNPELFFVIGTTMSSGKTTTVASMTKALRKKHETVVAIKATGCGAPWDTNEYERAGARTLDFVDMGLCSTYNLPIKRVARCVASLIENARRYGAQAVVVELSDGIYQKETYRLIKLLPTLTGQLPFRTVLCAQSAVEAVGALSLIASATAINISVVTGKVTNSKLSVRETKQFLPRGIEAPVFLTASQLADEARPFYRENQ